MAYPRPGYMLMPVLLLMMMRMMMILMAWSILHDVHRNILGLQRWVCRCHGCAEACCHCFAVNCNKARLPCIMIALKLAVMSLRNGIRYGISSRACIIQVQAWPVSAAGRFFAFRFLFGRIDGPEGLRGELRIMRLPGLSRGAVPCGAGDSLEKSSVEQQWGMRFC